MGEGVSAKRGSKCKERVSAERGKVQRVGKCRQAELGEEEMKVEVKNRRFSRRSEWK
jgi:hypothetical protein